MNLEKANKILYEETTKRREYQGICLERTVTRKLFTTYVGNNWALQK